MLAGAVLRLSRSLFERFAPMRLFLSLGASFGLALVVASTAIAGFVVPDFRGSADSTYQEWNTFTSALNGPNTPDVANVNPNGTAQLFQTTPGAFITGGGNIYSIGTATTFRVNVPDFDKGPNYLTRAVLQIKILGTDIDLDSVRFNGLAFHHKELIQEMPLGGFGGFDRIWKFQWNNVSNNMALNTFHFNSASSSLSLDRVAIDTSFSAVPEPSSGLLVALVTASGFLRRRRSA
jgi:hypothetical protein